MISVPLARIRHAGIAAPAILLAGAILAQTSERSLGGSKPDQSTIQDGRNQAGTRAGGDKSAGDADKKFRELDRRMSRTMRSVCGRC
ncbi:hypothetical protein [Microvirga sp. TS319]|uniref:hypothetical protein n=1 Tax=Microvirga sp. TS319 TaxID=3241165 RepID=UPI003519F0F8